MDDKIWDLTIVVISVLLAKALDEGIEALKKKTSRKPGKHAKRSRQGKGRCLGSAPLARIILHQECSDENRHYSFYHLVYLISHLAQGQRKAR